MANNKKKTISADSSNPMQTLINLWPYMWPDGRRDLKMRVVWATIFLLVAKLVLISVPYFFKWATDALNGKVDMAECFPIPARRRLTRHRLQSDARHSDWLQSVTGLAFRQRRAACGSSTRL